MTWISTDDPRISHSLRRQLYRILGPGDCLRRPKRAGLPPREELRREYLAAIVEVGSDRRACKRLARKYGCHSTRIWRAMRGRGYVWNPSLAAERKVELAGMDYGGIQGGQKLERAKRLAERDGWFCGICKKGIEPGDAIQIDHKIPKSLGGSDDIGNLQLAHYACNMKKMNFVRPIK